MQTLELRRLMAFGRQVHGSAERNLIRLREIDMQLEQLDIAYEVARQVNQAAEHYIDTIRKNGVPATVNANGGDPVRIFEDAREKIGKVHEALSQLHTDALSLRQRHEDDSVIEALVEILRETAGLHNNLNTLAWLIGESIADHEKPLMEEFTDVDELVAAIGR